MIDSQPAQPGFIYSCLLDGRGGKSDVDDAGVAGWAPSQGILWVHMDISDQESCRWLAEDSGVEPAVVDALLEAETRPRTFNTDRGMLVVLRGVNTSPGQDPEDMVSVRLWIERDRIISTRRRQLLSMRDMRKQLENGTGPATTGEFLAVLTGRLADRIGDFVDTIEEDVGNAEEALAADNPAELRQTIAARRREIAAVRRFLAPQRDALDRLYRNPGSWLSDQEAQELREESDRTTRYLEDLELARERIMVLREEFLGLIAQEQNARMYVLSVVAAIFLPLTFVTGLLGMNVGGLPWLDDPRGFIVSVILMVGAAVALAFFFRWKRWL